MEEQRPEFSPSTSGDGVILFQGPFDDTSGVVSGNLIYAINADNTSPNNRRLQSNRIKLKYKCVANRTL